MTITAGLFKLDITDHHAVLGFSLAADPKQVRKRYLKVARQLHPDSLLEASEAQKRMASELLSKMVNPAYEALGNEKKAAEHQVLLKLKQQQLAAQPDAIAPQSESAAKLLNARNLEREYASAFQAITATQFDDLTHIETAISELSELNAVYLMRQGLAAAKTPSSDRSTATKAAPAVAQTVASAPNSRQPEIIERYFSRAQEFESQGDYSRAILELREVIAAHPRSAACHGYLSSLYLQSGQATLAKVHAKQALAFDPSNRLAKGVQKKLNVPAAKPPLDKAVAQASKAKGQGSLLSGLFGGKKR
ncbi:MAG: DnaJ domain-containing protein [Phormidesmis sp.]